MTKRSYQQDCALAHSADLIGERWTLLLIRDLLVSSRRFNELQKSLKGMGSNLLAARLKELEQDSVIEPYASGDGSRRYRLTVRGRALEPAILGLIRWGYTDGKSGSNKGHHRDDWDLLALKAFFQPGLAAEQSLSVQYHGDDFSGWTRIFDGHMTIGLGELDDADLVVQGTVRDLFRGASEPRQLLSQGTASDLDGYMQFFAS
jgi:DNA-binding HxlR family transcriptional regulator